jgi:hypothetical protein
VEVDPDTGVVEVVRYTFVNYFGVFYRQATPGIVVTRSKPPAWLALQHLLPSRL